MPSAEIVRASAIFLTLTFEAGFGRAFAAAPLSGHANGRRKYGHSMHRGSILSADVHSGDFHGCCLKAGGEAFDFFGEKR